MAERTLCLRPGPWFCAACFSAAVCGGQRGQRGQRDRDHRPHGAHSAHRLNQLLQNRHEDELTEQTAHGDDARDHAALPGRQAAGRAPINTEKLAEPEPASDNKPIEKHSSHVELMKGVSALPKASIKTSAAITRPGP